jgi:hypothetical protein
MNWLFSSGPSGVHVLHVGPLLVPVALVPGAVVLLGAALAGSDDLPAEARSLIGHPAPADRVAPAPEGLSVAAVLRDWEEVSTSPATPRPARAPAPDSRLANDTTLASLVPSRKPPNAQKPPK